MTEILMSSSPKRVLEIGTGSGYQAAILSLLVEKVYTIERIELFIINQKIYLEKLALKIFILSFQMEILDGHKNHLLMQLL